MIKKTVVEKIQALRETYSYYERAISVLLRFQDKNFRIKHTIKGGTYQVLGPAKICFPGDKWTEVVLYRKEQTGEVFGREPHDFVKFEEIE